MEKLKVEKRVLKSSLTKLKVVLESKTFGLDNAEITLYKDKISDFDKKCANIFDRIFELCKEDEFELYLSESQEIQENIDRYRLIVLRAEEKLKLNSIEVNKGISQENSKEVSDISSIGLKLPELHISSFSGSSNLEWLSFSDIFSASVVQNSKLSNAQKLQYLVGALKGDALRVIQSLPITDANFQIAWDLLKERYCNKRQLVFSLIKRIETLTQCTKEDASQLLFIVDTTKVVTRSLENLGLHPSGFADSILVYLIVQKLDPTTRAWWERELVDDSIPTLKELLKFLTHHASILQQQPHKPVVKPQQTSVSNLRKPQRVSTLTAQVKSCCGYCKSNEHVIHQCNNFKALDIPQRLQYVKDKRLCFNCLRAHKLANCSSSYTCRVCHKRHNTLLHFEASRTTNSGVLSPNATAFVPASGAATGSTDLPQQLITNVSSCVSSQPAASEVLLCTAIVKVLDSTNQYQHCRVLLDPGSQASFLTEACFNRLGLARNKARVQISCLGSSSAHTNGVTTLKFSPYFKESPTFVTSAFIINKIIGDIPHFSLPSGTAIPFRDLKLADPNFFQSSPIDILLGVSIALPMLKGDIIKATEGYPFAVRSELGWIVSGNVNTESPDPPLIHVNHLRMEAEDLLSKFWKLDEVPKANLLTKEEQACEDHFASTYSRNDDGRYTVKLPCHTSPALLGDSFQAARRRFLSLERGLVSRPEIHERYREFIREYIELQHMEKVPDSENSKNPRFYLPHHAVFRETSSTTKLRVVFDGSCKSSSGLSLNDLLYTGPRVQQELFHILLRFRTFPVAVCADAEKMFRQIRVHPDDADLQRILWRNSPSEPIETYRLVTVSYGTASAPYLSTRVLRQLALDEKTNFPLASRVCLRDFYVDDLMSGESSELKAEELTSQLSKMMLRGGFRLHKWSSNVPAVLKSIPSDSRAINQSLPIENSETIKVLGIVWHPGTDTFHASITICDHQGLTKRKILSDIARLFDPMGWLAPVVIIAKIFIQELWSQNLGWDEVLSDSLSSRWRKFHSELPLLANFTLPRFVLCTQPIDIQLHAFCDASEKAYCAVVYIRSVAQDHSVTVSLLTSKTRVAPVKTQSLPRLELCSALLLATLLESIIPTLEIPFSKTFAWTDSQVALSWIVSEPRRWLPFVANRVAKIQEAVPDVRWNHVPGVDNPADCGTRGLLPSEFLSCELWTQGPCFLRQSSEQLFDEQSSACFSFQDSQLIEQRKNFISAASQFKPPSVIFRFSSFTKLCRVFAWVLRFINNAKNSSAERDMGHLASAELSGATLAIVKLVQHAEFGEELHCLKTKGSLRTSSRLLPLCPFLDSEGVLRVGGRLRNSSLSEDSKHPAIIPKKHHLTTLIIKHFHIKHLHASPQLLLSVIRQKFWIPCGRDVVRRFVKSCTTCFRLSASTMSQLMGDLPASRVTPSKAFSTSGVDFAGPFLARERGGRGKKSFKIYIAIFVCFATRAVHLEVVTDLTTQAFLGALKRFISRRGRPLEIISDCATNFVGADRELKSLLGSVLSRSEHSTVFNFSSSEGITWKFNPPAAPHHGGIWEAGVKSMKYHLRRTMGRSLLTLEELFTLTAQIEACLNSRPLCPLSSDPNDLSPLTPGHFLIGSALTAIPEPDLNSTPVTRLDRWQLVQSLTQSFWKRWSKEYLARLQQRPKWYVSQSNISVNDLVLIKNELTPPLKWRLARVLKLHPGRDEKVRVVTLKTESGELTRPITKLCRLPLD
jgi:hypothetical protein